MKTPSASILANFTWARVVPELLVADLDHSLRFWCDLCGFQVAFDRPEDRFAYLDLDGAQIMLEQRGRGRNWITAPLQAPLEGGSTSRSALLRSNRSWLLCRMLAGHCSCRPNGSGIARVRSTPVSSSFWSRTRTAI